MAYVIKTCEGCHCEFENRPGKNGRVYHAKRYCSRQCWLNRYNRDEPTHGQRGAVAAADVLRSRRGSGVGYVKEDRRHQHRVVAERILGRTLQPGEVVHHEDRNKGNNDPSNLIVFATQAAHVSHHQRCYTQGCQCICIRLEEVMPK